MRKFLNSVANLTDRGSKQSGITIRIDDKYLNIFRSDNQMTFIGLVRVALNESSKGSVVVLAQKFTAALDYLIESENMTFKIENGLTITGIKSNNTRVFSLENIELSDEATYNNVSSYDLLKQVIDASDANIIHVAKLDPSFCKSFGKILSDQRLKPRKITIECRRDECELYINIGFQEKDGSNASFQVSSDSVALDNCMMTVDTHPLASILKISTSCVVISLGQIREHSFLKISIYESDWLTSTYLIASVS